jgi:steroid delta-isomerase-like uncharacterized protein
MTTEQNTTLARRFFEDLGNGRNAAAASQIVAANHVYHDPANPGVPDGPQGVAGVLAVYYTAFPDAHWQIEEIVASDDTVTTRWIGSGTHKAPLGPIPPTGKSVRVTGLAFQRVRDGKIAETWLNWDALGLMQQLGVVPAMAG